MYDDIALTFLNVLQMGHLPGPGRGEAPRAPSYGGAQLWCQPRPAQPESDCQILHLGARLALVRPLPPALSAVTCHRPWQTLAPMSLPGPVTAGRAGTYPRL